MVYYGEVAEWFKATVLKTVVQQCTVSSNLTLSAIITPMSETIDLRNKPEDERAETLENSFQSLEPVQGGLLSWVTHLSPPPQRERIFSIAGVLVIAAVLVAIFMQDILLTIILGLAALVLVLNLSRPRRPSRIGVHATGISIDDAHHHFADMRSFWIDYQPHMKEVSIEFKKSYMPLTRIPLEDVNPLEIRQAMISYVPEKEHELPLLDHILRNLGL